MIIDLKNVDNIPWLVGAMCCLSDSYQYPRESTKEAREQSPRNPLENPMDRMTLCQNHSRLGSGLEFDTNGTLIGVDISHLNLTGNLHLESLPKSVRSLDLSFNDLNTLNLTGLKGKSLEILNVEHNVRCHINTECISIESWYNSNESSHFTIRELQVSSNQIFPWIEDSKTKINRIRSDLCRHQNLVVVVDGIPVSSFHNKMLRVLNGVSNKEVIPFHKELDEYPVESHLWDQYQKRCNRCRRREHSSRCELNLSGLGLAGKIDLRYLPRTVRKLDLSNNDLTEMLLADKEHNVLEELDLQNNDNLQLNLSKIELMGIRIKIVKETRLTRHTLVNVSMVMYGVQFSCFLMYALSKIYTNLINL